MNDEAATHYNAIIDQMSLGKVKNNVNTVEQVLIECLG